jgi:hypothetical protein
METAFLARKNAKRNKLTKEMQCLLFGMKEKSPGGIV